MSSWTLPIFFGSDRFTAILISAAQVKEIESTTDHFQNGEGWLGH